MPSNSGGRNGGSKKKDFAMVENVSICFVIFVGEKARPKFLDFSLWFLCSP